MESLYKAILPVCVVLGLGCASQANASVINNIGGIGYEWLEFSNTTNISRNTVETMLVDTNSALYGYRYATRLETQALLESYMPYVPAELNHWEAYLAPGATAFLNDFGITMQDNFGATYTTVTDDAVTINYNMYLTSYFSYGATGECGVDFSCKGRMLTAALNGVIQAQLPPAPRGFDATFATPDRFPVYDASTIQASLLVRELITVPLPAAAWLFANGMFVLFGFSRMRNKKSFA